MFDWLIPSAYAQINIVEEFVPAREGFTNIGFLVNVLLRNAFTIAGIIALVGVVIAGFNVVRHAGAMEGEKAAQAKGALTAAIVGLVIIVGAYSIIQIVSTIIGYNILIPPEQP